MYLVLEAFGNREWLHRVGHDPNHQPNNDSKQPSQTSPANQANQSNQNETTNPTYHQKPSQRTTPPTRTNQPKPTNPQPNDPTRFRRNIDRTNQKDKFSFSWRASIDIQLSNPLSKHLYKWHACSGSNTQNAAVLRCAMDDVMCFFLFFLPKVDEIAEKCRHLQTK